MNDEIKEIVSQTREYLEFYRELGLTEIGGAKQNVHSASAVELTKSPYEQEPLSQRETLVIAAADQKKDVSMNMPAKSKTQVSLFGGGEDTSSRQFPVIETLEDVRADIGDCRRCRLCEERTNIVFGEGNPNAELMFVGEGPGADEDAQGRPFVGRSGQLLTKIIEAMGIKREDTYIANIVKCRPPGNRTPMKDEVDTCEGFLFRQIAIIKPKVIVALGLPAAQTLMRSKSSISGLRGRFFDYQGAKLMPTFHPAYLLRSPDKKREVWEDMKKVRDYLAGKLEVD
ncbi:MAG TPA: uracil-DNA glycosylase [Blastocatellia bacterium]|nr:uracil-DNA glycosylase [Blastocatellia bacterium]